MKKSQLLNLVKELTSDAQNLATDTNSAIVIDVPENTSYVDFAKAVGDYFTEHYGTHLYENFLLEVKKNLK
jgi:hypothetical protein